MTTTWTPRLFRRRYLYATVWAHEARGHWVSVLCWYSIHKGASGHMLSLNEYEETYLALGVCVAANVPVILWGPPGQGKT